MKRALSLFLVVLFFIPSLACESFTTDTVVGSGNIVSQTIDVSSFDRVNLKGAGIVYIEQRDFESLSVQTDDNLISLLDIRVRGKELSLGLKPRWNMTPSRPITFNMTVKDLTGITISGSGAVYLEPVKSSDLAVSIPGSGNINIKGLTADNLSIDLDGSGNITVSNIDAKKVDTSLRGSGDIELEGQAISQELMIPGSGNYLAGELQTDSADLSIPGSADATVWVLGQLKVTITGSGDIQYYGKPVIDQSETGSGNIKSLGEK